MTYPLWYPVIERWVSCKMGRHGVTLPFIAGSIARYTRQSNPDASLVEAILTDIENHPVRGQAILASWCPDILAPVLSTLSCDRARTLTRVPRIYDCTHSQISLVYGANLISQWSNTDAAHLRTRLVADALIPVQHKRFSRRYDPALRKFEYGAYSCDELRYIDNLITDQTARVPRDLPGKP